MRKRNKTHTETNGLVAFELESQLGDCASKRKKGRWAAFILPLQLLLLSHGCCWSPSPTHFVARATLTLNSQVGRCRGRDAEAVARTAGVLPGILWLDPEDDEGAVDEDAHSELQVAAEEQRGRRNPVRHQHDGADILLSLSLSRVFSSNPANMKYLKVPCGSSRESKLDPPERERETFREDQFALTFLRL